MIAFHVAPSAARESIAERGLIVAAPNPRFARYGLGDQPSGVYVWETMERALKWARDLFELIGDDDGVNDVYTVDVNGLPLYVDPILGHQGARFIPCPIRPERVSVLQEEVRA